MTAVDPANGTPAALFSAPVSGRGVIVLFTDLRPVGPALGSGFGGDHPLEILITSGDGKTVIARSINPERWVGASLAGTPFSPSGAGTSRPDVEGTSRIYAKSDIALTGWRLYSGADENAALAGELDLQGRILAVVLFGLGVAALAIVIIYLRVARPITRLSRAVRSQHEGKSSPIPAEGPAQVRSLAIEMKHLLSSVQRELAQRTRAEDDARQAEASYRALFSSHPQAMLVADPATLGFIEVNEAAMALYGYSRDEFLRLTGKDIQPFDDLEGIVERARKGGVINRAGPWRHRKKDGTVFEVETTSHPVSFDGRGARVLMIEDVSAREELERQLRQSQRLDSLGQLAGGVAHDFNNLLAVILNYATFVKKQVSKAAGKPGGEDWQTTQEDITEIENAAERASRLTHQLLAFARREIIAPQVLDINEIVRDVEQLLRRTIGEHVVLETSLADGLWPVLIDAGQLEQVLVNLAVNARDAMPTGGTLTIDTENVDVDEGYAAARPGIAIGRHVRLRVSDSGMGMDNSVIQRAFEPFFSTKPKGEGTGLGLATVHGIVTQAGGRAQIYSEPGHGTTFTAMFPATAESTAAARAAAPVETIGGSETILVVEDEEALRRVTDRMLTSSGYTVLVAAGGAEAIELATQHRGEIHLLMTDVIMPHMLGKEVASRISELRPGIRVLFVSGYAQPVLSTQGTLDPDVTLLGKPYTEAVLLANVRRVLDAARAPLSSPSD